MDLPVLRGVDFYTVRVLVLVLDVVVVVLLLLLTLLLLGLSEARLLVDMDFLTVLGTTDTLLLGDVHLLLDVRVLVGRLGLGLGVMDGSGEGFVDLFFVTFPSDCSLL
jgi:hypothetical protein